MKTNTPNPLVPQGTFPDQRGKSHVRIAVFTILAVHMVLLGALLMAGCRKSSDPATADNSVTTPSLSDSSPGPSFPPPPTPPVTPTPTPAPAPGANLTTTTPPPVPPTPTPTPGPMANLTTPPPAPLPPLDNPPPVAPAAAEREYTIVKGDSFYTLAKKFSVSTAAIKAANPGVDSSKLKIGQKIKLPAPSATASLTTSHVTGSFEASSEKTHVVKSGETLTAIAKAEGVSVKALSAANRLKTSRITVGQKLKVPSKAAPAAAAAPAPLAPAVEPIGSPTMAPVPTMTPAPATPSNP